MFYYFKPPWTWVLFIDTDVFTEACVELPDAHFLGEVTG